MVTLPAVDPVAAELIDGSFVPRRSSAASVELDGELVLAGGDGRAAFYRLDPVASLIWSCFDGSGTTDEIASDLAAELEAPASVVAADVLALTKTLARLCFLAGVPCDPPSAGVAPAAPAAGGASPAVPLRLVEPPSG